MRCRFRERHIEAAHTAALVAVNTCFVGVHDCHSCYTSAKPTNKVPATAVRTRNNEVLPPLTSKVRWSTLCSVTIVARSTVATISTRTRY